MAVPLLKNILIAKGGKVPEGLDPDETDVVDPNALDEDTVAAVQTAAGGGEEMAEGETEDPDVEDEEEPEPSALEGVEATTASLQQAAEYVDMARTCADTAEKIAETIPDAEKHASEAREAADEATSLLEEVQAAASDPEKVEEGVTKVMEAYERANAACEEAKAYMPDIDLGGGEEPDEMEEGAEEGENPGGLSAWAQQKAGME